MNRIAEWALLHKLYKRLQLPVLRVEPSYLLLIWQGPNIIAFLAGIYKAHREVEVSVLALQVGDLRSRQAPAHLLYPSHPLRSQGREIRQALLIKFQQVVACPGARLQFRQQDPVIEPRLEFKFDPGLKSQQAVLSDKLIKSARGSRDPIPHYLL